MQRDERMKQDMKKTADHEETTMANEDFLHRWSRRKHEAQQLPAAEPGVSSDSDVSIDGLLTDADMPPLDTLTEDSDYSGFLSPKVSEALRQQALRQLFRSPGFNVRDGLDDYDDDFTAFAKLGDVVTSDMKHQVQMEARRLQQRVEQELAASQEEGVPVSAESSDSKQIVNESSDSDDADDEVKLS